MKFYNNFNEMYNSQFVGASDVSVFNKVLESPFEMLYAVFMDDDDVQVMKRIDSDFDEATMAICVGYGENDNADGYNPLIGFRWNPYTRKFLSDEEIASLVGGKQDYTYEFPKSGVCMVVGTKGWTKEEAEKVARAVESDLNDFMNTIKSNGYDLKYFGDTEEIER